MEYQSEPGRTFCRKCDESILQSFNVRSSCTWSSSRDIHVKPGAIRLYLFSKFRAYSRQTQLVSFPTQMKIECAIRYPLHFCWSPSRYSYKRNRSLDSTVCLTCPSGDGRPTSQYSRKHYRIDIFPRVRTGQMTAPCHMQYSKPR